MILPGEWRAGPLSRIGKPKSQKVMASSLAGLVVAAWLIASYPLWMSALLLVLVAAVILLIKQPWLVWPVLAIALPFFSSVRLGPITATELLLASALLLWLSAGARTRVLRLVANPVLVPVLAYVGVLAFSSIRAPDLEQSIAEIVKWVEFAAIIVLVPAITPRNASPWLAAALVAGGITQAILGLYQFIFAIGPEWFILFDRYMRASGSFNQPNPFAGYLGLALPLAVSLALHAWGAVFDRDNRRWSAFAWAAYYSVASAVIAGGLFASWSRGGWLGAVSGFAVVVILRTPKTFAASLVLAGLAAVAAVLGVISSALIPAGIQNRLLSLPQGLHLEDALTQTVTDENFSALERLAHWVAALRMWERAPWLGVGPGNYAVAYSDVRLPAWEDALGHAHNLYLNILAETGLIGLVAFAAMWLTLVAWVWRSRCRGDAWCVALSLGVLGALVHASVHNIVDNLFVQGIYLHIALLCALLSVSCSECER